MNDQMNAPMSPEPAGVSAWFSVWMNAVTKPSEQTFAVMAEHPDAMSAGRAFTWVFLAGTVSALISGVLQSILLLAGFSAQTPGLTDLFGNAQRGVAFSLGVAICSSPVAGAIAVLFFAIGVGITQWVAKMFGGTGTFSKLAYAIAAISVPFSLISSFLTPFSSIQIIGLCTGAIAGLLGIYAIVLNVMAVKGVNKFGWGQAVGSAFLPMIALCCLLVIPVIAVMRLLGPQIGDTFSSINSTLP